MAADQDLDAGGQARHLGQGSHGGSQSVGNFTSKVCVYTPDYEDKSDVRRVLRALRQDHGIRWRLSYKTDQATEAGVYGRGSAIYVSQPGSLDFEDRRKPPQQALF